MFHRFHTQAQPRQHSIEASAIWNQDTGLPVGLQAECPVCREIARAYWNGKGPSFDRIYGCRHYVDIVSGGGTRAFMIFSGVTQE